MITDSPSDSGAGQRPAPSSRTPPGRIASAELLGQAQELIICHAGEDYRLRITSKGKLILTK